MRKFNISSPNILAQHYTLSRLELIEKGKELVHTNRYFTIPTSVGTGKSTYFRLLGSSLKEEGYWCVISILKITQKSRFPLSWNA